MARLYSLFSSSKGNATFVGTPEGGVLIDCGISAKRLLCALERCGLSPDAIRAVFITHDHSDHVSGLRVLTNKHPIPIYVQPVTMRNLPDYDDLAAKNLLCPLENSVAICGIELTPFATSHDTEQSCGYRIEMADGTCCAVCTDLGTVTDTVRDALTGCRMVLLEANYDDTMLSQGSYPLPLQERIRSDHGHLSNTQSGEFAKYLVENGTVNLLLGHLSQENNTPQKAEAAVVAALGNFVRGQDYLLNIAKPETGGEMTVF